jgi:hypothetical protein
VKGKFYADGTIELIKYVSNCIKINVMHINVSKIIINVQFKLTFQQT